jgi:hypothetical protein
MCVTWLLLVVSSITPSFFSLDIPLAITDAGLLFHGIRQPPSSEKAAEENIPPSSYSLSS